jgi:threonine 3-dehydrogenase
VTDTATATVWRGGTRFERVSVPLPTPGPGETLVRVRAATVCGSDRHSVLGRRPAACPSVLGHEGTATVVATDGGTTVDGTPLTPGDRVVFGVTASCGECATCRRGLTAKCERVRKVGHESFDGDWPLSGTWSTHLLLPAGLAVVTVPDDLPDDRAATAGCAVATVMAMLEKAGPLAGRSVLVNGVGMLGITAVAAARYAGAAEVIAVDPADTARELALTAGADRALRPGEDAGTFTGSAIRAAIGAVDVSLELSGAPAGVRTCVDALATGGTAVLAGSVSPAGTVNLDPERLVRGWNTVTGVHNYELRHLARAVDLLVDLDAAPHPTLPWERMLSAPRRLDGLDGTDSLGAVFTGPSDGTLRTVLLP